MSRNLKQQHWICSTISEGEFPIELYTKCASDPQEDMDLDSEEDFEDASDHFSMEDNFLEQEVTGPRKPEPLSA